jgi:hypothetical protein
LGVIWWFFTKIAGGSFIVKYGETIGRAKEDIELGAWTHSHNTEETYAPTGGIFAERQ